MRVIMLALVLANVLFFMWSTWVAEPPVEPLLRQAEGTAELRLMSELDNPPAVPATAAAESADVEPLLDAGAETVVAPTEETSLAPMLAMPADVLEAALPAIEQEPTAVAQAPPETPAVVQVVVAELETRCASLGPYLNLREATEAASRLRAAGLAPRQRLSEEQVWVGHWVYLPSFEDRDAAVEIVERLRAEGVKDIYIEPRGDRENAVSLGLFSDRENAELFAGQVRQYEVKPQITDRYRFGSAYWVDITLRKGQTFDLASYEGDAVRKVRLEEGSCPALNDGESDPVD